MSQRICYRHINPMRCEAKNTTGSEPEEVWDMGMLRFLRDLQYSLVC